MAETLEALPRERVALIERYRQASAAYHVLVGQRSERYREFDCAASELFLLTAAIGAWNREHKDLRIEPADCRG